MNRDWTMRAFGEVLEDCTGGNVKTLQSEYQPAGRFPVIDQGKDLITGYVDDPALLCKVDLPAIIFGDHTRILKFADFPFCLGADGVKVLRPAVEADQKFLFHQLRSLTIPEAGYSRHFKFLKRMSLVLPPIEVQRRIAAILDKADALRQKRSLAIQKLDCLTQSIFLDIFGDPAMHAATAPAVPLAELVRSDDGINYGVVQPGDDFEGGVPLVRVGDFTNGKIDLVSQKLIDPKIEAQYRRSRLRGDELLISCVGSIGTTALCRRDMKGMNIARAVARVPADPARVNPVFLLFYLKTPFVQHYFQSQVRTVNQPTLNIKQINETPVYVPARSLQDNFANRAMKVLEIREMLVSTDGKIETLFSGIQHMAFRGEL